MNLAFRSIFVAAASVTFASAFGVDYIYTATLTTASPTFNRPLSGTPPTGLSAVGNAVFYTEFKFTVNTSGTYTFTSVDAPTPLLDNFGVLYLGGLTPTSPLANALAADDDAGAGASPFISYSLTANTGYSFVTTMFSNNAVGTFTNTISGPGTVRPAAVPEPASMAALGLGVAALVRRRRAKA